MLRKAISQNDFKAWKDIYMQESVNPFMVYGSLTELEYAFPDIIQRSMVYVFENEEGDIVGICRLTPSTGDSQHIIEINSFAISEQHRGKKYANKMLDAILKEIEQQPNIIRIQLSLEGDNPLAQHIYETVGFEIEASYEDWYRRYEGTHQGKWFVSEHFMVKFIRTCEIKPLISSYSISAFIDTNNCTTRKATKQDLERAYSLYQKQHVFTGLTPKAFEEFATDYRALLSNDDLYICEVENNIIGLCHLSPFSQYERLKHSSEVDLFIIDPDYSAEIASLMWSSIMIEQRNKGIKRIEMTSMEGDDHSLEACKLAGFEIKGKFSGVIKHPQGHYLSKVVLECSLFDLTDAIEFIKTCHFEDIYEKKIIRKLDSLISRRTDSKLKEIQFENSIYKTIKSYSSDPIAILRYLSVYTLDKNTQFFSAIKTKDDPAQVVVTSTSDFKNN